MGGEGERPREPKHFRAVRARGDARPPDGGSGAQGVDQLIHFVRKRLHLGLGGRIGDGPDQSFSQRSTLNQPGELTAHFARGQR
jgi:hypothetical protein